MVPELDGGSAASVFAETVTETAQRILLRRDTAANWTSVNPVLALAEVGLERDTGKIKIGDSVTAWNDLAYFGPAAGSIGAAAIIAGGLPESSIAGLVADLTSKETPAGAQAKATAVQNASLQRGANLSDLGSTSAARANLGLGSAALNSSGAFDPAGAAAVAQAASQPFDSDLTAIAALSTTTFGRGLLALADAAAGRSVLGLGSAATSATTDFDIAGAAASEATARSNADALLVPLAQKGSANGVATLGADSKVPGAQLPAVVNTVNGQSGAVDLSGIYAPDAATTAALATKAAESGVLHNTGDEDRSGALRLLGDLLAKSGRPRFDARAFGATAAQRAAFMNGVSKPLSGYYGSLAAAQAAYPVALALSDELDWAIAQTALNAGATTTNPVTTGRIGLGRVQFDAGVCLVNRPLSVVSVNGFFMEGAGWATEFRATPGSVMENVLDLNGVCFSVFRNFRVNGPIGSGQVNAVLDFYWNPSTAQRSTSGCMFKNIWIGGANGRFINGFGISRASVGAVQTDNSSFEQITVSGGGKDDGVLWKNAFVIGNGASGNQTDFYFWGLGAVLCDTGIRMQAVKNLTFKGASIGALNTLFYVAGSFDWSAEGFNMENVGRIIDGVGATSAAGTAKLSNFGVGMATGNTFPADGEIFRYYTPGTLTLEDIRIFDVTGAATPVLLRARFATAALDLTVKITGMQITETFDNFFDGFASGRVAGFVRVHVEGFSEISRSTFAVTSHIGGPLTLTPSSHLTDLATRFRTVSDTQDRYNQDVIGTQSWGPGGTTAPDTTLGRRTGGGLALAGGPLNLQASSTLHSGTGVPASGLGANGDFYLRFDGTSGASFYQKRSGAWVALDSASTAGTVATTYGAGASTWTKPTGTQVVRVFAHGGGGGGGSGRKGLAGTARVGGGGGGTGGYGENTIQASSLGATVSVTVGAGGTGGAAVTAASTNGNDGGAGNYSYFGAFGSSFLCVAGGAGGTGGQAGTGGAGGGGASGVFLGATGGAASATGGAGASGQASIAGSGAAGGGISTADAAAAGGTGGGPSGRRDVLGGVGGAAGVAGGSGASPGAGIPGSGGGGGGGSTTGNGGAGGAAVAGAGGGGGGAAVDGTGNSGAGGNGGDGFVVVLSFLG